MRVFHCWGDGLPPNTTATFPLGVGSFLSDDTQHCGHLWPVLHSAGSGFPAFFPKHYPLDIAHYPILRARVQERQAIHISANKLDAEERKQKTKPCWRIWQGGVPCGLLSAEEGYPQKPGVLIWGMNKSFPIRAANLRPVRGDGSRLVAACGLEA